MRSVIPLKYNCRPVSRLSRPPQPGRVGDAGWAGAAGAQQPWCVSVPRESGPTCCGGRKQAVKRQYQTPSKSETHTQLGNKRLEQLGEVRPEDRQSPTEHMPQGSTPSREGREMGLQHVTIVLPLPCPPGPTVLNQVTRMHRTARKAKIELNTETQCLSCQ